ncbi:MAG: trigger factor [Pseudomonadota bacterium]|jgi:trigger factor
MKVTVEKTSEVERKLNIEIPWEKYQEELDRQLAQIRKSTTLKGFRKGKAPMEMVRRIYSEDAGKDAVNALAGEAVRNALAEHDLKPFGSPYLTNVDTEESKAVNMEAIVELEPAFEVADYSALELFKPGTKVTEAEVDKFLENMRQNQAETVTMEEKRGLKDGDVANMDFTGSLDGKPLEDLKGADYLIQVGKSETVPGFEEQIVGMEAGQDREFDLPFPEDFFKPELAGQVIHFNVHLKEIRELQLPDLDDEFAKDQGDFKDIEELKKAVRENIGRMKESDSEKALRRNLVKRLVEDNEFEVPPSLVDRELRRIVNEYGENLVQSGLEDEKVKATILENEEELKNTATENIRLLYIVKAIGEKENIEASEEEVQSVVAGLAARMGKTADDLMNEYRKDGALEEVGFNVIREKVFKKLLDSAKIKEIGPGGENKAPTGDKTKKKPAAKKGSKK